MGWMILLLIVVGALGFAATVVTLRAFVGPETRRPYVWVAASVAIGIPLTYAVVVPKEPATPSIRESSLGEPVADASEVEQSISNHESGLQPEDLLMVGASETGGITVDEVIAVLKSESLTELQRSRVVQRLHGQRVQWRVIVREVSRIWDDPSSDLHLVFTPRPTIVDLLSEILVARFPSDAEVDLTALSSGDSALVEGSLTFSRLGEVWKFALYDCRLLMHQPSMARKK